MNTKNYKMAYDSLLSCMIGLVSTIDLHNIKATLYSYPNDIIQEYYKKAIIDHCKMTIYNNDWIM